MLLANYISLQKNRFRPGFGSACVLKFKTCITKFEFSSCARALYNCGDVESDSYRRFIFPSANYRVKFARKIEQNYTMAENIANKNMCKFYVTRDKKMYEALCKQRDETFDQECDSIGCSWIARNPGSRGSRIARIP